jgi:hypothetical protein
MNESGYMFVSLQSMFYLLLQTDDADNNDFNGFWFVIFKSIQLAKLLQKTTSQQMFRDRRVLNPSIPS